MSIRSQACSALATAATSKYSVPVSWSNNHHFSITSSDNTLAANTASLGMTYVPIDNHLQQRGFAKKKSQVISKKKKHEMKKRAKKSATAQEKKESDAGEVSVQHKEWVDFQKSISVDGFETGQMLEAIQGAGNKGRLMKGRKRAEEKLKARIEKQKKEQEYLRVGGGEFPTLRYSDEETERLLEIARQHIPPRAGPRRSRHLKREKRRWWLVREIRKKYKKNIIKAHFRRMEERKQVRLNVKAIIAEAPEKRASDRDYQLETFRRWRMQVGLDNGSSPDDEEWEDIEDSGEKQKM